MPMAEDNEQIRTMNIPAGLGEALLHSASDAIIATDREGNITFWNPGAERIFGFTAKEAVGQSLDLIIPENLRARHWSGFRHTMATGTSRYGHGDLLSVPGLTKDGRADFGRVHHSCCCATGRRPSPAPWPSCAT